jgi:outer membrane protein OmpA-like peptidoglycan-associated protein
VSRAKGWLGMSMLLLASVFAAGAPAQDEGAMRKPQLAIGDRWYVSPMASFTFADGKRDTDDGIGGALLLGKAITPRVNLEGHVFHTAFEGKGEGGDVDLTGLGVDFMLFPLDGIPALFGLGGVAFGMGESQGGADGDEDEDSVVLDAGFGYLLGPFDLLNRGSLRLETRARFDQRTGAGDLIEPVLSVGLLYPFGAPAAEAPAAFHETLDVVPPETPSDADGDGVPDDLDACPETPVGAPVDTRGCPVEARVEDLGERSNLNGAVLGDSFVLRGVNFDFDQDVLRPDAKDILDGVTQKLVETAPEVKLEVGGHTDEMGTPEYNQALSERRAKAVSRYLQAGGVARARVSERGYGETQPVAPNDTEQGRAQNRRVELKVMESAY